VVGGPASRAPRLADQPRLGLLGPFSLLGADRHRVRLGLLQGAPGRTSRRSPKTTHARRESALTLLTAGISVPLNVVFRYRRCLADFQIRLLGQERARHVGRICRSASRPSFSGLIFVLLFGAHGLVRPMARRARHKKNHFPSRCRGIVNGHHLRDLSRSWRAELTAVMQAQGSDEEEAAPPRLGAQRACKSCFAITLPQSALGACSTALILCNGARPWVNSARSAWSSGHVRGPDQQPLPLQVEILYNEYNFVGAFPRSRPCSLRSRLVTLCVKKVAEWSAIQSPGQARRPRCAPGLALPLVTSTGLEEGTTGDRARRTDDQALRQYDPRPLPSRGVSFEARPKAITQPCSARRAPEKSTLLRPESPASKRRTKAASSSTQRT